MSTSAAMAIDNNQVEDLDRAEYVTIRIGDQLLGIPVLTVQDVLGPHNILRIPLARLTSVNAS
jgi:chemotaxis signal transduction protein